MMVTDVKSFDDYKGDKQGEEIAMVPVTEKPFDGDGNSEDNSFARWTPSGGLSLAITNPSLFGVFSHGQKYYLDFTPAD